MFILIFGTIIIISSLFLQSLIRILQRHFKFTPYPRLEWSTNATLQLQRLAHEELGLGDWENTDEAIPFTKQVEYLGSLDLSNDKHPRLKHPESETIDPNNITIEEENVKRLSNTNLSDVSSQEPGSSIHSIQRDSSTLEGGEYSI